MPLVATFVQSVLVIITGLPLPLIPPLALFLIMASAYGLAAVPLLVLAWVERRLPRDRAVVLVFLFSDRMRREFGTHRLPLALLAVIFAVMPDVPLVIAPMIGLYVAFISAWADVAAWSRRLVITTGDHA